MLLTIISAPYSAYDAASVSIAVDIQDDSFANTAIHALARQRERDMMSSRRDVVWCTAGVVLRSPSSALWRC